MSFNISQFGKVDLLDEGDENDTINSSPIHVRIQQRNGRKTLTIVQGLSQKYDKKILLKSFKKGFSCNGSIGNHTEYGEVIQVQGDQRKNIAAFLVEYGICKEENIKVHGF